MRQIKITADDRPFQDTGKPKRQAKKRRTSKRKGSSNTHFLSSLLSRFIIIFKVIIKLFKAPFSFFGKKNNRSKTSSRRKQSGVWAKVAVLGGGFTFLVALVGFSGFYVVKNGLIDEAGLWAWDLRLTALGGVGMVVQEVSVAGRDKTPAKSLMTELNVVRGDSIVDFDPNLARTRIEKLGWVEHASVMRRFPDEIFIRIQERRPFARWQINGKTAIIDRKGVVIEHSDNVEFQHLPKVVGIGANERAAELFDLLADTPTLFTRLQNAVRVRDRRWNLEFSNGVKVLLPEEGSAVAWAKLNDLQQEKKILNKGVLSIDLRAADRMYVRLRPADAEFRRDPEKKT